MNKDLETKSFFDLSSYEHQALFDNCEFVWLALRNIQQYLDKAILGKKNGEISPQAFLVDPELISIGEGSVVEPGAYIKGPCIIGKRCVIRHGAYIRGQVITGDDCIIGHDSEVKNSIFLNKANAPHFAYLGDSILGNDVNLGAGTKCANLRLDRSNIIIHWKGQHIETPFRKFGAIVGDRTQIGCNSVTNPGTLLGKDVLCYPCTNIGGFVASGSIVKPKIENMITESRKSS